MHFPLGQTVITPGAIAVLANTDVLNALALHAAGDWGDVCSEDRFVSPTTRRSAPVHAYYRRIAAVRE